MGHVQDASETDTFVTNEESPLLGSRLGRLYDEHETNGSIPHVDRIDIEQFDKSRWRSIRVMYLSVFLGAITFTITMSSLWPFLQVLDPSSTSDFLGWVVASYSLGQLIASPLFGAWANLRKSSKEPLVVSLTLMTLANMFYTYLQSMPNHRNFFMILARGLIGFSAGNVAVVRSYVSGATTVQERTSAMANLSMCQAMGFILGPVFQSILVLVKYPGPIEETSLHFNMYTAPAFFAASVALINLVLFLVIFKEYRLTDNSNGGNTNGQIASEDQMEKSMDAMCQSNSHDVKDYKLDMLAVLSSIYLFFVVLFMFTVFETIGTPLSMHMYAWSKSKATFYQGIILGAGGCLSICVFAGTKMLARKYNERYLLLIGFLFCFVGYFAFIPWGHTLPPRSMAPVKNNSHPTSSEAIYFMVSHILYNHKDDRDNRQRINEGESILFLSNKYEANKYQWTELEDKQLQDNEFRKGESASIMHTNQKQSYNPKFQKSKNLPLHQLLDLTVSNSTEISHYFYNNGDQSPSITNFSENFATSSIQKDSHYTTTKVTPSSTFSASFSSSHFASSTASTTNAKTDTMSTTNGTTITSPSTTNTTRASHHTNNTADPEGCPWEYDWCGYVPVIPLFQYLIASFLITIGYPMCNMLTYTIYSKVLGPKPQGLWMGWLTASGSFARTVGPIYVSQIYDNYGPQVTYGSITSYVALTILFYLFVFRRLVPFAYTTNPRAPLLFWRKRNRSLL